MRVYATTIAFSRIYHPNWLISEKLDEVSFKASVTKNISFIQEENIDDFLKENGFYYTKKTIDNEYCYVEIDLFKTDINSFYNYNENSDVECWRRFITIKDDALHINDTNPNFILNNLKKILEIV